MFDAMGYHVFEATVACSGSEDPGEEVPSKLAKVHAFKSGFHFEFYFIFDSL